MLTIEQEPSRRSVLKGAAGVAATAGITIAGNAAPAHAHEVQVRRGADLVIVNGEVLTMDRRGRRGQAVAIKNGRIVAVVTNRDVNRLAGRGTQVVDAHGGTVLPGINDGHLRFNGFGFEASNFGFKGPKIYAYDVGKTTAAEIAAVIARAVQEAPAPDSWIRAGGWDGTRLDRLPTRDVLDPVSDDHPVYMFDIAHHAVAANSKAMQLAGITRDTVPLSAGVIEKDAGGEPTGIFREGASGLVTAAVPPYTEAEISEAMDFAASVLHCLGITSLTDPGVGLDQVDLYRRKIKDRLLKLRVNLMHAAGTSTSTAKAILDGYKPIRDLDPRWLRVGEVKVFGDGVPTDAETSWLHEPFIDGRNGHLNTVGDTDAERVATLHAIINLAVRRGFQVGTHATGDATIDAVVAGYLATRTNQLRHYVIHGDLTPRGTLKKMARNGIGVSFNPTINRSTAASSTPLSAPNASTTNGPSVRRSIPASRRRAPPTRLSSHPTGSSASPEPSPAPASTARSAASNRPSPSKKPCIPTPAPPPGGTTLNTGKANSGWATWEMCPSSTETSSTPRPLRRSQAWTSRAPSSAARSSMTHPRPPPPRYAAGPRRSPPTATRLQPHVVPRASPAAARPTKGDSPTPPPDRPQPHEGADLRNGRRLRCRNLSARRRCGPRLAAATFGEEIRH
ncbi:N-substituted formamide deformylase precursor [Actinomadura madurae]|nr:amidohydrolase family protein [Actinomadura madurae]SPT57986.1 N-substituted formamide deformylase precursor [Actinomadura madurae]